MSTRRTPPAPLNANDTMAVVLVKRPVAARILLKHRMHCVGCAIAPFETLAEACEAYGVVLADLLDELEGPTVEREVKP